MMLRFPFGLATVAWCVLVLAVSAQAQQLELDPEISAEIPRLEAELRKSTNPAIQEIYEDSIAQIKRGELIVTRPITDKDRWNLVAVQFLPESGRGTKTSKTSALRTGRASTITSTRTANAGGFESRGQTDYENPSYEDTASWYEVSVTERPPQSLKPGEVFEYSVQTSGSFSPGIKFFRASGLNIYPERELETLKATADANDLTCRTEFPTSGIPYYVRYGVASSSGGLRVIYVYQLNGEVAPRFAIAALDANPQFNFSLLPGTLKPSQLIRAKERRAGTTADGVSQLLIRVELSGPEAVQFRLENEHDGSLAPLLDGRTVKLAEQHYAFALYTPPEDFDTSAPTQEAADSSQSELEPVKRLDSLLAYRTVTITAETSKPSQTKSLEIQLARPPVILVHGLFSDPIQTWVQTFDNGKSMVAVLEDAGFLPFLVNYQKTNGTERSGSWLTDDSGASTSSFADNRRVVWDSPIDDYIPFKFEYGHSKEKPVVSELQKPKHIRIGGISEALTYYRDELDLAATQATVVGHSMGGLLARVWASEHYNPEYKRAENFMEGDIDRLLTLNTPHHGSELMELKDALLKGTIGDENWLEWGRRQLVNTVIWWYLDPEPGAMSDMRPGSTALRRIGPTVVPSYAIATKTASNQFNDAEHDPLRLYDALYSSAATVFFNNRPLLDDFIESRYMRWKNTAEEFRAQTDWNGAEPFAMSDENARDTYKRVVANNLDHSTYYWAKRREADYQKDIEQMLNNAVILPYGFISSSMGNDRELDLMSPEVLASQAMTGADVTRFFDDDKVNDIPETFLPILRDLIFHQDPENDGAVRVSSQTGGLEAAEVIEASIVHSYSAWDGNMQERVLFVLKDGDAFDASGFPVAGQLTTRYLPSKSLSDDRVFGEAAIAWSGMVPSHAAQYLQVSDAENVFVLVRPVNLSSTELLKNGAAAKGMNVKGKSSNWGPQIGYIPFKQRYSKLWRIFTNPEVRNAKIEEYDEETAKCISKEKEDVDEDPNLPYAVALPLEVDSNEGRCEVLTDPDANDAEAGVVLRIGEKFYDWRNSTTNELASFDPEAPLKAITVDEERKQRLLENPMLVLADVKEAGTPYLTADYDLLAIGFYDADAPHGPPEDVINADFHPLRGNITQDQIDFLEILNNAVLDNTPFDSGWVTHHGPENQYGKSPYVDYPILVFDPGEQGIGDAEAYLVLQGPPGFRDIHLKRLFAEKIQDGFHLWPNPESKGWDWESRQLYDPIRGYDPRDAADLKPYVKEAPRP